MIPNMLTVAKAAKKWKVSEQRVRQWIADDRVPATWLGVWVIPGDARKPKALPAGRPKKDAAVSP